MRVLLDHRYFTDDFAVQRESIIDLARYCLPQVFFYGMFVLVGQVLNARRSFGPMMWAPIANNVISVAVLTVYLLTYGRVHNLCRAAGVDPAVLSGPGSTVGGYTSGQELLLGLGSTLGIAAQLLILVPFLKRAGFTFRPRFDFRGTGLGHTLQLGVWTVLFVVVNQVAYTVVVKIASSGTADAVASACAPGGSGHGTGYTIYSQAFLLVMVPHSIATVSLATAMLPQLAAFAADRDLHSLGRSVGATLRTTYAMEGYSVDETARILDCAPGTVKSRCSRGRARLLPLLVDLRPVTRATLPSGNQQASDRVPPAQDPGAARAPTAPLAPEEPPATPEDRSRPTTGEEVTSSDT